MKKTRKALTVLLSLLMIVSAASVCFTSFAAEPTVTYKDMFVFTQVDSLEVGHQYFVAVKYNERYYAVQNVNEKSGGTRDITNLVIDDGTAVKLVGCDASVLWTATRRLNGSINSGMVIQSNSDITDYMFIGQVNASYTPAAGTPGLWTIPYATRGINYTYDSESKTGEFYTRGNGGNYFLTFDGTSFDNYKATTSTFTYSGAAEILIYEADPDNSETIEVKVSEHSATNTSDSYTAYEWDFDNDGVYEGGYQIIDEDTAYGFDGAASAVLIPASSMTNNDSKYVVASGNTSLTVGLDSYDFDSTQYSAESAGGATLNVVGGSDILENGTIWTYTDDRLVGYGSQFLDSDSGTLATEPSSGATAWTYASGALKSSDNYYLAYNDGWALSGTAADIDIYEVVTAEAVDHPATCVARGFASYTFTYGGTEYTFDAYTTADVDSSNHVSVGVDSTAHKDATCMQNGFDGHLYCTACNADLGYEKVLPIDPTAHKFDRYVNNGNGTHDVICSNTDAEGTLCAVIGADNASHTYDASTHLCACGALGQYTITYYLDGGVHYTQTVNFGDATADFIDSPAVPEGYSFSGWYTDADCETAVSSFPADTCSIYGKSIVNSYDIVYYVDGVEHYKETVAFGTELTAIAEPEKTGYTFSGWSAIPETMPVGGVTVNGAFSINSYDIVYYVDGVEHYKETVAFGTELTAIAEPEKTGYTFSGWSEIPETMPVGGVTVNGTFSINSYVLTINYHTYFEADKPATVTKTLEFLTEYSYVSPVIDGYTADKLVVEGEIPDDNVTVDVNYARNEYDVDFYVNGVLYKTIKVAYGDSIVAPEYTATSGYTFSGWGETGKMGTSNVRFDATTEAIIYSAKFVMYYGENTVTYTVETTNEAFTSLVPKPESKFADGDYDVTFDGWDKEVTKELKDVTYTAIYNKVFIDADYDAYNSAKSAALIIIADINYAEFVKVQLQAIIDGIAEDMGRTYQPTIDAATAALSEILADIALAEQNGDMKYRAKYDYNRLNTAIDEAEAILDNDDYFEDDQAKVKTALDNIKAVIEKNKEFFTFDENGNIVDTSLVIQELTEAQKAAISELDSALSSLKDAISVAVTNYTKHASELEWFERILNLLMQLLILVFGLVSAVT